MVQFGINLLPAKKIPTLAEQKFFQKFKRYGLLVLVFYIILVAVLFGLSLFLSFENKKIKAQTASVENQIKSLQKIESLQVALKERVNEATKITKARFSYKETIEQIQSLLTEGIIIQDLDIKEGDKIAFSGTAQNAAVLSSFIDQFKEESQKKIFSQVTLSSTGRTQKGEYTFSLEASLIQKK